MEPKEVRYVELGEDCKENAEDAGLEGGSGDLIEPGYFKNLVVHAAHVVNLALVVLAHALYLV